MDYKEQLKRPRWQKKRLEILNRDKFTCQKCQDTETELQIHHLRYDFSKLAWEYENKWLITLCKHCHQTIEELKSATAKFNEIKIIKTQSLLGEVNIYTYIGGLIHMRAFDNEKTKFCFILSPEDLELINQLNR